MKNVLLATSALVAFAGAAAAEVTISASGSADAWYDVTNAYFDGAAEFSIGISASAELNNGVVASVAFTGDILMTEIDGLWDDDDWYIDGDQYWVAMLETSYGTLSFGSDVMNVNLDDDDNGEFNSIAGMSVNKGSFGGGDHEVRVDGVNFGGVSLRASADETGNDVAMNLEGEAGGFGFQVYYETSVMGFAASTMLGGIDLGLAYADDGAQTSTGLSASYAVTDTVTVSGSYADNSVDADDAKVKVAYDDGAFNASVEYDALGTDEGTYVLAGGWSGELTEGTTLSVEAEYSSATSTTTYSAEVMSAIAADTTLYAGINDASDIYAAVVYDLGGGASAYAAMIDNTGFDADLDLAPGAGTYLGVSLSF